MSNAGKIKAENGEYRFRSDRMAFFATGKAASQTRISIQMMKNRKRILDSPGAILEPSDGWNVDVSATEKGKVSINSHNKWSY